MSAAAYGAYAATAGCSGRSEPAVTVGAKLDTENKLIGEIAAQHVARKLRLEVARSLDMLSTPQGYQGLLMTNLDAYPDDTTSILSSVLKEEIPRDPGIALVRVRQEMARIARVQVLEPLGMERRFVMIARADEAEKRKVTKLSEAANGAPWMLAQFPEFQSRRDGYSALLGTYALPQQVPPKTLSTEEAYKALDEGSVNLIAGYVTDGRLEDSKYVALQDDRDAFLRGSVCLLVRHASIDAVKGLKEALSELSSRMGTEQIRKLNHLVSAKRMVLADVAAKFPNETKF